MKILNTCGCGIGIVDDSQPQRTIEIIHCQRHSETNAQRAEAVVEVKGPKIVCLCGSTRFIETFLDEGWRLTLEGKIVLSVGVWRSGPANHAGEWIGEEVKQRLDELHKRKIDLADEVFVLNVGGYIGDSTRSEIEYAQAKGKPITYLEPDAAAWEEGTA